MSLLKVGYWAYRGRVEPIHMYLEYNNVPYEKITYTKENPEKWGVDKNDLGIDFPNIPYIIDGDVKLSQTNSILKYLEMKFGSFYTGDIAHDIKLDTLLASIADIYEFFGMMCHQEGEKTERIAKYVTPVLVARCEYFNEWFQNKKYLTGDNLCVADFTLWTIFDYNDLLDPNILASYENIQRFKKDFENEPRIDTYLKNPNYKKFPILPWTAAWGGKDYND